MDVALLICSSNNLTIHRVHSFVKFLLQSYMLSRRGGGGGCRDDSPENHKNIGFLSNTGPDPLKNHKATKPAFKVEPSSARQRNAI